ncbi:MAG: protein-glutamate methylesterase/protein-glutamine glutaminase [Polyangiales bacterium]
MSGATRKLRLMVVDDSAYNRRNIADIFGNHADVEVIARAGDGEEALRLATQLKPDVITLDLEMPRMDGFTFLRILMSKQPTPVIVVSSYSQKENVFKALELGALDFVAKPDRTISPDSTEVRQQILEKVLLVRSLRPAVIDGIARPIARRPTPLPVNPFADSGPQSAISPIQQGALKVQPPPSAPVSTSPKWLVAIACSTGGPSALLEVVGRLPTNSVAAFAIAQHMPDKFTRTFAERLGRRGTIRCGEAQDGDVLVAGSGFVCPGRQCMEVFAQGGDFKLRVGSAAPTDRYVPSADRLFKSAAQVAGPRTIGVILTGMGDDGTEGARAIREAGGIVIAESQETAVVFGMPGAAVRAGIVHEVLPLPAIAERLAKLA